MFCLCPCSGRECLNTQALAVRVPFTSARDGFAAGIK